MISYHADTANIGNARAYARGFVAVDTDDVERIAKCIGRFAWSCCVFAGGHRHKESFLAANWIGLDFDSGDMTLDQARRVFCDCIHVIGVTKSHGLVKGGVTADRFRVVLKLTDVVHDMETYRATVRHYVSKYDSDAAAADAARFFWPCRAVVSTSGDGYCQEIVVPETPPAHEQATLDDGELTPFALYYLSNTIPVGERNGAAWRVLKDLMRAGYSTHQAITIVLESPTYRHTTLTRELRDEFDEIVRSAERSLKEKADV